MNDYFKQRQWFIYQIILDNKVLTTEENIQIMKHKICRNKAESIMPQFTTLQKKVFQLDVLLKPRKNIPHPPQVIL